MTDIIKDGEPVTLGDLVRDYPQVASELRITIPAGEGFWGRAASSQVGKNRKLKEEAVDRDISHKEEVAQLTRERDAAEKDRDLFGAKWKRMRDRMPNVERLRDQIKEIDEILDWFGSGRCRMDALRDLKDERDLAERDRDDFEAKWQMTRDANVDAERTVTSLKEEVIQVRDRANTYASAPNSDLADLRSMSAAAVSELTVERAAIREALGGDDTRPFNTRIREMKMKLADIRRATKRPWPGTPTGDVMNEVVEILER